MTQSSNPYIRLGWGLFVTGLLTATVSYFIINIIWVTALGLAMLIIAVILLALARSVPKLSPELSHLLFETGTNNLSILFEELAVSNKAVYLPTHLTEGKPRALIPLAKQPGTEGFNQPLSNRLIVRYGQGQKDIGLLVSTPGTTAVNSLNTDVEANVDTVGGLLTSFFSGTLGNADSVNVSSHNETIKVTFSGLEPLQINDKASQILGSPPASVAAAVTAAAWNHPITITSESGNKKKYEVILELLK